MCATGARADLSYTQTMSLGGVAINSAFKGKMRRVETSAFGQKNIMISQCGSAQITRVAPSLKIYTSESPLAKKTANPMMNQLKSMSVVLKDLGNAKVGAQNARHWKIVNTMTMKNGKTMPVTVEIWSGPTAIPSCPQDTKNMQMALQNMGGLSQFMGGKMKISGDSKALTPFMVRVPLKMTVAMNAMAMGTLQTSAISQKNLSATLFAVPAGYKKVTPAQFDAALAKEMRAKMGAMMGGMGMPNMGAKR